MNKITHGRIAGAEINCAKAVSGILPQAAWMLIALRTVETMKLSG
jgi:hypothetical protein